MHYLINAALFLHEILTYYRVRRPLQVEYKNYVKKYRLAVKPGKF